MGDVSGWWLVVAVVIIAVMIWRLNVAWKLVGSTKPIVDQRLYYRAWKTNRPGVQDKNETGPVESLELDVTEELREMLPDRLKGEDKVRLLDHEWLREEGRNMIFTDDDDQIHWAMNHIIEHEVQKALGQVPE